MAHFAACMNILGKKSVYGKTDSISKNKLDLNSWTRREPGINKVQE